MMLSRLCAERAADVVAAAWRLPLPDLKAGPPYRIERNSSFREATAQAMIASLNTPAGSLILRRERGLPRL